MTSFPFDTHQAFKSLRDAGVTDTQAEALVTTMCEALRMSPSDPPFHPESATKRLCGAGFTPKLSSAFVRVFRKARGERVPEQHAPTPHHASN